MYYKTNWFAKGNLYARRSVAKYQPGAAPISGRPRTYGKVIMPKGIDTGVPPVGQALALIYDNNGDYVGYTFYENLRSYMYALYQFGGKYLTAKEHGAYEKVRSSSSYGFSEYENDRSGTFTHYLYERYGGGRRKVGVVGIKITLKNEDLVDDSDMSQVVGGVAATLAGIPDSDFVSSFSRGKRTVVLPELIGTAMEATKANEIQKSLTDALTPDLEEWEAALAEIDNKYQEIVAKKAKDVTTRILDNLQGVAKIDTGLKNKAILDL